MVKQSIVAVSLFAAIACGSSPSPTSPEPSTAAAASVTAITIARGASTGAGFQLSATAALSDGTAKDVTTLATWRATTPTLATVNAAGLVTVLESGDATFEAAYQSVTGSMRMAVVQVRFAVTGRVATVFPNEPRYVSGISVIVTSGTNTGAFAISDDNGYFTLSGLRAGVMNLGATRPGYYGWVLNGLHLDDNQEIGVTLFPLPPINSAGERATAQCNDATWTWTDTTARACLGHGGIAWGVCPGPLCEILTSKIR
jgi:hypothetical protein